MTVVTVVTGDSSVSGDSCDSSYSGDSVETVVLARLFGQLGLILWGLTSDCAHFFLSRVIEKIKIVLDPIITQKNDTSAKS